MHVSHGPSKARRSTGAFFALVVVFSIPIWIIGGLAGTSLLPGLPLSALATFCPAVAALILVARREGRPAAARLVGRSVAVADVRPRRWYVPALLLMPLEAGTAFMIARWSGTGIPDPAVAFAPAVVLAAVFFVAALAEEIGWSGYAIDPLQARWGALGGSLILGAFWAAVHYVPLLQANRSADWIAWWSVWTVASRVLITWLYDNAARSILIAALFHASQNVCWQLFPVAGSYFDPRVWGLLSLIAAGGVIVWFGPASLTRRGSRGDRQLESPLMTTRG